MIVRRILAFAVALLLCQAALAGQSCQERQLSQKEFRSGLELAYRVHEELARHSAKAALVGRVGRDLSEYRLRYSHVGLAVWDEQRRGYTVVHLLNHCGRADSALYDEGLGNFFTDDTFRYESIVLIPSIQMQAKLIEAIAGGAGLKVHEPAYSLIAHPYSAKYQNSNQWLLEFFSVVADGHRSADRVSAQDSLQRAGYKPSVINLPPLKRLGARLFAVNTKFDDHSMEEWSSSQYQIVSAESVLDFVARIDPIVSKTVISLP